MHLFIFFMTTSLPLYSSKIFTYLKKWFIWLRPTSAVVDPESPPIVEEMTVKYFYLYGVSLKLPYGFLGKAR